MCKRVKAPKIYYFGKKRKKVFHGTSSRNISPSPAPNSQISCITQEFQDLELSNKAARLNDTVESNVSHLELGDV